MADEKEDPRAERRSKLYNNKRSQAARGGDAEPADGSPKPADKAGAADPKSADTGHLMSGEVLGRHEEENEGLRKAHEGERRDEHTRQRDEHRTMNTRHKDERASVKSHTDMVAMNRKHEHEKERMRRDHEDRHRDMASRHQEERHGMNMKHEAEMMGAAGAGGAAAPTPQEAGNEGPAQAQAT
jgi:hypothetical protein